MKSTIKHTHPESGTQLCPTCSMELHGKFCHTCGEKSNTAYEYSLNHFFEHTIEMFTHFDSKFFNTLHLLVTQPGKLTSEYLAGRRVKYMKPLQLYILMSALFYLFLPKASIFFANALDFVGGDIGSSIGFNFDTLAAQKYTARNMTKDDFIKEVNTNASHASKTFLFLLLPFIALSIYRLYFKKNRFFVPHLIFSMHLFSFFILLTLMYLPILKFVFNINSIPELLLYPPFVLFFFYIVLASKKTYGESYVSTVVKSVVVFAGFMFWFVLYRYTITITATLSM